MHIYFFQFATELNPWTTVSSKLSMFKRTFLSAVLDVHDYETERQRHPNLLKPIKILEYIELTASATGDSVCARCFSSLFHYIFNNTRSET